MGEEKEKEIEGRIGGEGEGKEGEKEGDAQMYWAAARGRTGPLITGDLMTSAQNVKLLFPRWFLNSLFFLDSREEK